MGHSPPTMVDLTPVMQLNLAGMLRMTAQMLLVMNCAKPKAKVDVTQISHMLCATQNLIPLHLLTMLP